MRFCASYGIAAGVSQCFGTLCSSSACYFQFVGALFAEFYAGGRVGGDGPGFPRRCFAILKLRIICFAACEYFVSSIVLTHGGACEMEYISAYAPTWLAKCF